MRRLVSALLLLLPGLPAAAAPAAVGGRPVLLVVTGAGGEPRYDERFHTWAATLMDAAEDRYGLPAENVIYLAADPERDPGRARDRSRKEIVEATLDGLASSMPAGAPLFIVVIGHGSFRDGVSKVNLPGPDMTAEDFAAALEPFGERPVVFANLASASGGFVRALSGPGRTVITATKSGMERNLSVFGQFFVAAFVGDDADVDNDGRLSVLEAFNYARREVERAYGREQKIVTEHALLDDDGDGDGSAQPGPEAADGQLAATLTLTGVRGEAAPTDDPELARLYEEKAGLERGIADLRGRKESLGKEEYERELEELLVGLALANRAIRDRQAGPDDP